jgi:hypothetical protein
MIAARFSLSHNKLYKIAEDIAESVIPKEKKETYQELVYSRSRHQFEQSSPDSIVLARQFWCEVTQVANEESDSLTMEN